MTATKRIVALALGLVVASAGMAMAGQQRPYRLSDQQLTDLVKRIDSHGEAFRASVERAIDRSPINGSSEEDQIDRSVEDFEKATDRLRDRVHDRQFDTADADNVLRRASVIDAFMMRNRLDTRAQSDWQALRVDMDDLARAYGVTWSWRAASRDTPYRFDDKQVEQLLKRIEERADRFGKSLDGAFDRGGFDDRREGAAISQSVKDLKQATSRLRDRGKGRQANTLDVDDVLRRGGAIDGAMQRYQLTTQAEQNWLALRADLDQLARAYNVSWNWSNPWPTASEPLAGLSHRLTGTYQLENGQADDPRRAAERAVSAVPPDQRQGIYQNLLARLEAPELIAIERHQNSVTMASTRGPRVTFEADGRDQMEQWSGEQTMKTRATLEGERLVVVTTGNRGSDFTAIFDPLESGRSLHMTRTIDESGLSRPVTVRSVYRRVSDEARWNLEVGDRQDPYANTGSASGGVVPDGTRFMTVLDNALSVASARDGDLYTMTTRSPSSYEGAVIHGVVSNVSASGGPSGRAGLRLSLRSIRLRNGSSYRFDGVIEDIRTPDGQAVRVDREGTVDNDDSRTRTAAERAAIGAALGAIIGAVAGGGKGAAIGAVIGAGGGAGTVFIEGRDRLDLPRGTEFSIISGDPGNQRTISDLQR